ncbi:MAG: helix-turn-helix domain-containing protein [Bacteroidia bacterium]
MAKLKTYTLEELTDKHIGKRGTIRREVFEYELRLDLLGKAVRDARKQRNLTQEELGKLVGVQKAQISKIENSVKDVRVETVIKVFAALRARISFSVEMVG